MRQVCMGTSHDPPIFIRTPGRGVWTQQFSSSSALPPQKKKSVALVAVIFLRRFRLFRVHVVAHILERVGGKLGDVPSGEDGKPEPHGRPQVVCRADYIPFFLGDSHAI